MPNWCCTNYIASGDRENLQRLADTLNTMPNLENGFGKFWLGNFFAAAKGWTKEDIRKSGIYCRGTFDPNFQPAPASPAQLPTRRQSSNSPRTEYSAFR